MRDAHEVGGLHPWPGHRALTTMGREQGPPTIRIGAGLLAHGYRPCSRAAKNSGSRSLAVHIPLENAKALTWAEHFP
ncbi:hypothetical protein GCM10027074_43730 [Streptomyces deserti]